MTDNWNEKYAAWLREQPPGEIVWYSDSFGQDYRVTSGWVDIVIDEMCTAAGCNWAWTIESPLDPPLDPEAFTWPHDYVAWLVWDSETWETHTTEGGREYSTGPEIHRIYTLVGEFPSPEQLAELNECLGRGSSERCLIGRGAWSADTISKALTWWTRVYAGRTDLTFVCDLDSKSQMLHHAEEAIARIEEGTDQTYLLSAGEAEGGTGNSVYVSDQVMDFLLDLELNGGDPDADLD